VSGAQQRIDTARRQADREVTADERVVHLRVGDKGAQMGDDSTLWWPVTYEATRNPPVGEPG
jgi:hypothetical protein